MIRDFNKKIDIYLYDTCLINSFFNKENERTYKLNCNKIIQGLYF